MNRSFDIVMFALPRWDQPISSPALSLAKEFAKENRVFYIEHPYSWKDVYGLRNTQEVIRRRKAIFKRKDAYFRPEGFPENLTIITPPGTIPVNFLPPGKSYNYISRFNDQTIFNTIRRVIRENDIKDWIYINSYDPFFARQFPADLQPYAKIYQSMDDISQEPYTARHGLRLEEEIVRNFDFILTTSKELTRLKSKWNPNTFFHPNAADISLFRNAVTDHLECPKEIQGIDKKVIGFTGSVEYRTDFELLKKLALAHSDKLLCVVGPVFATEVSDMGIDQLSNVKFVGARNIKELPAYLQHMDVVIIPYKRNTLTKSIYPLKINEYLGAGKPVVSTHFSEDIFSFNDVAYIAEDHDQFISLIDKAIEEDTESKKLERVKRAEENTWSARVEQFCKYFEQWEMAK